MTRPVGRSRRTEVAQEQISASSVTPLKPDAVRYDFNRLLVLPPFLSCIKFKSVKLCSFNDFRAMGQ